MFTEPYVVEYAVHRMEQFLRAFLGSNFVVLFNFFRPLSRIFSPDRKRGGESSWISKGVWASGPRPSGGISYIPIVGFPGKEREGSVCPRLFSAKGLV